MQAQTAVHREFIDKQALISDEIIDNDFPIAKEVINDIRRDVHIGHAGVAGKHDVLRVVLIGLKTDGACFDAQRDIFSHQYGIATFVSEV